MHEDRSFSFLVLMSFKELSIQEPRNLEFSTTLICFLLCKFVCVLVTYKFYNTSSVI